MLLEELLKGARIVSNHWDQGQMSMTIKTEKQIIEDAFLKKRSFGIQQDGDIDRIIFNESPSLKRTWERVKQG